MTHPLAIFNYEGLTVRTIERDGEPWFVANDVAEALGYSRSDNAITAHCKSKETYPLESGGQVRHINIIPERDVYRLIMRSKLPTAEKFESWVVGEVLPSIRKTGAYSMQPQELIARAVIEAQKLIEHQTALIAEMKPKAEFFDTVTDSTNAIDIGTVAKVLNCGIGRTRLFEFLRDTMVLQKNNIPFQRYIDSGYFRIIESKYSKPDGSVHINLKTVVYQKGVDFIRRRLADAKEAA